MNRQMTDAELDAQWEAALEEERSPRRQNPRKIDIARGSFGCPGCTNHFGLVEDWEAVRGDGGSYSGVYATVTQNPGEDDEAFEERAEAKADEIRAYSALPCRQDR